MNNNWHKKEKPLLGLTGLGGGVDGLGVVGAAAGTKYIDEVFSTYVYEGNGSSRSISNEIDLSSKGGMVWIKKRNGATNSHVADTARGITKYLTTTENYAELTDANRTSAITASGFSLGTATTVNNNGDTYASWTFAKQKGFFDIVTFTGNGSVRTISHGLGSIPGLIMIKNISSANSWFTYHRDLGPSSYVMLNHPNAENSSQSWFMNDTAPTATEFTLGTGGNVNQSGDEFVAYLFAGGASSAATARSVDFDDDDGLDVAASSDFNLGNGTFCLECWVYLDDAPGTGSPSYGRVFQLDGPSGNSDAANLQITINPTTKTIYTWAYDGSAAVSITGSTNLKGAWHHIAVVRTSDNIITQYVDGIPDGTETSTDNFNPNSGSPRPRIGSYDNGGTNGVFNGKISNLRVTVGQPVYTAAFIPSKEPLTTTSQGVTASNVKLLCCNNSSTTGSTVTSGTITANGDPTASTDIPFDDPNGFKFGADEDKGIIKMGSYTGNGSSTGPEIDLGWEPQFILLKRTSDTGNWALFDCMRGIVTEGDDPVLQPDLSDAEYTTTQYLDVTPTGFQLKGNFNQSNANGDTYIFTCIRRPDGYVGKLPSAATGVFAMDTGSGSSTIPNFDSGFPVDLALIKPPAESGHWWAGSRLIQGNEVQVSGTSAETAWAYSVFDSNVGWQNYNGHDTSDQSWMFKRGQGLDVVTYKGNGAARSIAHNLNQVPQMIWVKDRTNAGEWWPVYHKDLNGGTNPEQYYMRINDTQAETTSSDIWNNTAPTSTHFTVGSGNAVNQNNADVIAILFASSNDADGNPISKVGTYTGNALGGASGPTITLGFQPRFIFVKSAETGSTNWYTYDTLRGLSAGNDERLQLNDNSAQTNADDIDPSATGFQVVSTWDQLNGSGERFIYYAHA